MHSGCVRDAFGMHSGCFRDAFGMSSVRDAFGMRSGCVRYALGMRSGCDRYACGTTAFFFNRETVGTSECEACTAVAANPKVAGTYRKLIEAGMDIGTKLEHLIQILTANPTLSVAVPTQYITTLKLLEALLKSKRFAKAVAGREVFVISGEIALAERQVILDKLHRQPHILLFTIWVGGMGWNLLDTALMYIMEPHWNPQIEQQAVERIHRLYHSYNKVYCYHVHMRDTVGKSISCKLIPEILLQNSVSRPYRTARRSSLIKCCLIDPN
jgi:SNF2 family DNA or RNA helicase